MRLRLLRRRAARPATTSRSAGGAGIAGGVLRCCAVRGKVAGVRGAVRDEDPGVWSTVCGLGPVRDGVAVVVRNRGGVRGDEGRAPSGDPAPVTAEGPGRSSTSLNTNAFKSGAATSFFGVYDGHGGPAVSKYCAKHLHTELRKHGQFRHGDLTVAIQDTFLRMDQMMRKRKAGKELSEYGGNENWDEYKKAIHSRRFLPSCLQNLPYAGPTLDGCTVCVVLIRGNRIFVGNVGDSRCVLSRNDQAIALSTDHKPDLPAERHKNRKCRSCYNCK